MTPAPPTVDEVMAALSDVVDPELDEPITDLGFVRSVLLDDDGITVHLRLPTAFCSPNFAYLMASDAQDVLESLDGIGQVRVLLDDHHDSEKINAGLAADAGYRGTFGVEAVDSLDELRETFRRKAHIAALERCLTALLRDSSLTVEDIPSLTLSDIPPGKHRAALIRRRLALGLTLCPAGRVFVDEDGVPIPAEQVPMKLRFAKSVRISIEGNSHFCRGLLATRYADEDGTTGPRIVDARSTSIVPVRRVS